MTCLSGSRRSLYLKGGQRGAGGLSEGQKGRRFVQEWARSWQEVTTLSHFTSTSLYTPNLPPRPLPLLPFPLKIPFFLLLLTTRYHRCPHIVKGDSSGPAVLMMSRLIPNLLLGVKRAVLAFLLLPAACCVSCPSVLCRWAAGLFNVWQILVSGVTTALGLAVSRTCSK